MKSFFIVALVSITIYCDPQPEFYFNINDPEYNHTYYIGAQKAGLDPVYIWDNSIYPNRYVNTTDQIWLYPGIIPIYTPQSGNVGYDLQGSTNWQGGNYDLGRGLYKVTLYTEWFSELFSFYLDTRYTPLNRQNGSLDVIFHFNFENGNFTDATYNYTHILSSNQTIRIWETFSEERQWDGFVENVVMTNDFGGSPNSNITISLDAALEGIPDPDVYPVGYDFLQGETGQFWRGADYTFSVEDIVIQNKKPRQWNNGLNGTLGITAIYTIEYDQQSVIIYYLPVAPVSIENYLEGGSSIDEYKTIWQNGSISDNINFGTNYYAFPFSSNSDIYTLQALPISTQRFNTIWSFYKWNNGSYNSTISNIKIPDDIPAEGSFIANYKGHFRSDNSNSFTTSGQHHLVRDSEGYYHLFYISMDNIWYTKSLTTNFNGAWSAEDLVYPGANVKSLSVDIYNNTIYTVIEVFTGEKYAIQCLVTDTETGTVTDLLDIADIDQSYFGRAHPVVAVSENEKFFLYRRTSQGGLYYSRYCTYNGVNYNEFDVSIANTSYGSLNPSIAVNKAGIPDLHLTYEEGNINGKSIRYRWASGLFYNQRTFTGPLRISEASTYDINTDPSLSLFKKNSSDYEPIVSWLGGNGIAPHKSNGFSIPTPRLIVRACDDFSSGRWGTTNLFGEEVNSTQNNSVLGVLNQSVVTWGQKDGTESKWVRRNGMSYYGVYCLSPTGYNINICNGTSLSNMKAISFDKERLPYVISPSETIFSQTLDCGGQQKVITTYPFTFSRAGVIIKNGVEFAYHTGDVVVDDSAVHFIEVPDTLIYNTPDELNQILRTKDFPLNPNSSLMFSDYYYVLNKELADSLMSEDESVGFKVELVNSISGNVAGTFDNIVYDKNNLDDYENISYQVNCSGITEGNYFFRLVTTVTGDAEYYLVNAVNDANTVAKRSFNNISFTGDKIPKTYELSQNYPNPFNPATTINYQLPQTGFVTLKIYDILGSQVATLVNEQKNQGKYSVNFNASRLASGVYIYQLRVNDYISSKKMLLLR